MVRRLLLDLCSCSGTDTLSMLPLFLKNTADVLAPHLSVVFGKFLRLGTSPACWRQANVTIIQKDLMSSCAINYLPIPTPSVLSNVFERLVSVRL